MKIVCAWCKKRLGEKEPFEDKRVTHSQCPACKAEFFPATIKNLAEATKQGGKICPT